MRIPKLTVCAQFSEEIRRDGLYAESLEALTLLASLHWKWHCDPASLPYVRIRIGKPPDGLASLVAVGYRGRYRVAYATFKKGYDHQGGYAEYPANPFAKPVEAIDTRILTGDMAPAEAVRRITESLSYRFLRGEL